MKNNTPVNDYMDEMFFTDFDAPAVESKKSTKEEKKKSANIVKKKNIKDKKKISSEDSPRRYQKAEGGQGKAYDIQKSLWFRSDLYVEAQVYCIKNHCSMTWLLNHLLEDFLADATR